MHGFNWFALIHPKVDETNVHIVTAVFLAILLIVAGLFFRRKMQKLEKDLIPSEKLNVANVFELIIESLLSLMEGVIGPDARRFLPLIGSLFIFVFFSNLLGLIPGFLPPTANINTNLAMALCVFLYFNYVGIKEHGVVNYFKHFAGPVWWMAPLIMAIELFGVAIRPITLSLRLLANINADHLVLGIFSDLVPLIVPVVFMILGIFIAFVQAFVFTLLSIVYIALAKAHEEAH